jgi:hypothetical protein
MIRVFASANGMGETTLQRIEPFEASPEITL